MSLPWFAFHIDKFLSDTLALDSEAGGGYLFLMLHYYATEKPPRDNDRTLATIARMPMDRWLDRRPDIEVFFQIRDGYWHHATIEKEMLEAGSKLARSHARAKAAGDAYAAKIAAQKPQAGSKSISEPKKANEPISRPAPSRLTVDPETIPETTHLHLHLKKDSLSTEHERDWVKEEVPDAANPDPDEVESLGMGTPIDPKFSLGENQVAVCKFDGASLEIIEAERQGFVNYHLEQGSFSNDWDASWARWWARWKEYVTKQAEKAERIAKRDRERAPARVEVNNVPDWDSHCGFWKSTGKWPRGIGPDPDSQACKAPQEILIKHGLRKETVE